MAFFLFLFYIAVFTLYLVITGAPKKNKRDKLGSEYLEEEEAEKKFEEERKNFSRAEFKIPKKYFKDEKLKIPKKRKSSNLEDIEASITSKKAILIIYKQ